MIGAVFSGKICIFFIYKESAKRISKNRVAGTMEVKLIIVNREVIRVWFINKVFLVIRLRWLN